MSGRRQQSTKRSQWGIGSQVNHQDTVYHNSDIDQSQGKVVHTNNANGTYYAGTVTHNGYPATTPAAAAKPEPQQNSPLAAYMASLSAEKAREVEDQFMRYMFMNAAAPQQSTPQATPSPLQFALPATPQRLAIYPGADGSVKQLTGNELLAAVLYQNK
ncbi:hypothetical protein HGRIS_005786 [Hohenbuehelia grisea]|uniref:Uncharacterized protein n=1 Tax=Hohenbuehelia grisea TaxID=104357 RepID=A0ABR3JYX7_9AGAR